MKLSPNTLNILKNFATIQPNLVVQEGSTIKTIAENRTIMASATVAESFDRSFGIYELNTFLNTYGLTPDADIEFGENEMVLKSGKYKTRYRYADKSILTHPDRDIKLDDFEINLTLESDTIAQIQKACSTLGHRNFAFCGDGKEISLKVFDSSDATAHEFIIELGSPTDHTFELVFDVGTLKVLLGDYEVSLSSKLISRWVGMSPDSSVTYFIALEKTSTFN